MARSLESYKSCIGQSETAHDVVTASMMLKYAATFGLENAPSKLGEPIPPGWHGGFFPPSHRPTQMREDGQAKGGGIMPAIPLPRRRIGGNRLAFHDPLRVGDAIERVMSIADLRIDENADGARVTIVEKSSISSVRGLAVEEEREVVLQSEGRAAAPRSTAGSPPFEARWRRMIEPTAALLFRFSALRFNSHRIHYDRDYTVNVEKLPGLVVQSSLISQLLIDLAVNALPGRPLTRFEFTILRQTYDTGQFTICGSPSADDNEAALWSLDSAGEMAVTAKAKFAPKGN